MNQRIRHEVSGSRVSPPSRWRRIAFAFLLAIAGAGAGGTTAADAVMSDAAASEAAAIESAAAEEPVRARLVCDRVAIAPGGVAHFGLLFDIDPGWHLFWDGCNNTGYPIQLRAELPEGFSAREPLWPAPTRLVSPGDILDHVYAARPLVILPVDVPRNLEPGANVTITCALEWVSCREACVIGGADVSLTLQVAAHDRPAPSEHAALFEQARARVPDAPGTGLAPYRTRWEGDTLVLEADAARALAFFPQAGCEALVNPLVDCAADGSRLAIRTRRGDHAPASIRGVLELTTRGGAAPRFVSLDIPFSNSPTGH